MADGDDILDHVWDLWCWLCQEAHRPCETNEYGQDVGMLVDERASAVGPEEQP